MRIKRKWRYDYQCGMFFLGKSNWKILVEKQNRISWIPCFEFISGTSLHRSPWIKCSQIQHVLMVMTSSRLSFTHLATAFMFVKLYQSGNAPDYICLFVDHNQCGGAQTCLRCLEGIKVHQDVRTDAAGRAERE